MPVPSWQTEKFLLPWSGLVGQRDTAIWTTPVFDFRPNMRSSNTAGKQGLPIWNTYYARLYIQLFGLLIPNSNTEFLSIEYREWANTTFATTTSPQPPRAVAPPGGGFPPQTASYQEVVPVTAWVDATSEVMHGLAQPDSVVLEFEPVGSGYPIRYWRIELRFTKLTPTGIVPTAGGPINLQATVY
jgi:hypothetical protein